MYQKYSVDGDLLSTILKINNVSLLDLNVDDFKIDLNQDCLLNFKNGLELNKDKKFFIVGDYDFDGISSTTLIKILFDKLKIDNNFYIPSRYKEGYGINEEIINIAYKYGFNCLLLLDNGVVAYKEIELARKLGLEVFIIDHHEYEKIPDVKYIIHPRLLNDNYYDSCTCGLCNLLSLMYFDDDYCHLLAGIASIADMVSVFKYNRYLIKNSLKLLNTGLYSKINLLSKKKIYTYEDLSFSVIPKINAVSRMNYNPNYLVNYFYPNSKDSFEISKEIDLINEERKNETKKEMKIITSNINIDDDIILILSDEIKEGLCGLLATRLSSIYNKPSIVLSLNKGVYKGSGRGINGFNLHDYFDNFKYFETFGGHEGAIGLSIEAKNINLLKEYINVNRVDIKEELLPVISLNIEDFNIDLINDIDILKPFGTGFKEPLFYLDNVIYVDKKTVINKYIKYIFNDHFEAILFDESKDLESINYIVGKVSKGYRGNNISMTIEDLG